MVFDGKILKGLIPYFGGFLIVCGYLKLNFFYSHFNIQILNYLELSEIITLFLNIAIKNTILILLCVLFIFIFESSKVSEKINQSHEDIQNTDNFLLRFKKILKSRFTLIIILIFFSLLALICYSLNFYDLFSYLLISNCCIIGLLIVAWFLFEFDRKYKLCYDVYFDRTYFNLVTVFSLFVCFSIESAFFEIKDVESGNKAIVSFKYSDKIITSNNQTLYIGETKEYLFLYDKKMKTTSVFPKGEISDFTIRK
jgi:hypothetical protein